MSQLSWGWHTAMFTIVPLTFFNDFWERFIRENDYDYIRASRLFSIAMGIMAPNTITKVEVDIACEALKNMADQRQDWTEQQRGMYKWLVDCAKEIYRREGMLDVK